MMTREEHDRVYGKDAGAGKSPVERLVEGLADKAPNPCPVVRITERKGVEFGLRWSF